MTILSAKIESTGQSGTIPNIIYIDTNDQYEKVISAGYLQGLADEMLPMSRNQMALVSLYNGSLYYTDFFRVTKKNGLWSLTKAGGDTDGVNTYVYEIVSSGTYNVPQNAYAILVQCVGGGGAGGGTTGASPDQVGQGGGGGGFAQSFLITSGLPSQISVNTGAAGVGAVGANGGNGGTTNFGPFCVATGGRGGATSFTDTGEGEGGLGVEGDILGQGGQGIHPQIINTPPFGNVYYSGAGGASFFGSGGGAIVYNSSSADKDGKNAASYGAGGGGAFGIANANKGGDGGPGFIMVTEYY